MEILKKANGDARAYTDDDQSLPNLETEVQQSEVVTDMSRRVQPPPASNWNFPLLFSISAVVFTAGGLVTTFSLKTATQPQDHDQVIRLQIQMEEISKKMDALTEQIIKQGEMKAYQDGVQDAKMRGKK